MRERFLKKLAGWQAEHPWRMLAVVLVITLLFSGLLTGGSIVQLRTQLHSSLSGIIQGTLVLFMLLFGDYRKIFKRKQPAAIAPDAEVEA